MKTFSFTHEIDALVLLSDPPKRTFLVFEEIEFAPSSSAMFTPTTAQAVVRSAP